MNPNKRRDTDHRYLFFYWGFFQLRNRNIYEIHPAIWEEDGETQRLLLSRKAMITVVSITFVLFFNFFSAFRALFRWQIFKELNATLNHEHHLLNFLLFAFLWFYCIITDLECQ